MDVKPFTGLANQGNVTVFPEPVGMAASFNDKLVFDIFNAVPDEMRAKHNERVRKRTGRRPFPQSLRLDSQRKHLP